MKRALTYTIIAGNKNCTNDCPICISRMTPDYGIDDSLPKVDWPRFEKATTIALNHGAETVLITGKGEPTLFPGQITQYLNRLYGKQFDRREIQTNGALLAKGGLHDDFLDVWKDLGLDTVAISIYYYNNKKNKEMFRPRNGKYFDLSELVKKLHSKNLNVRLSCVMLKGYIDKVREVVKLIEYAKSQDVYQLTLRTADKPRKPLDLGVAEFVDKYRLDEDKLKEIKEFLEKNGSVCDLLPHGAVVYEVRGQNVCMTTGLTHDVGADEIRQLIFFPQGWLTTSWENVKGGRIL